MSVLDEGIHSSELKANFSSRDESEAQEVIFVISAS